MSEKISQFKPNDNDRLIVDALRGEAEGLTIAGINAKMGSEIKAAHITHALMGGFIESCGEVTDYVLKTRPVTTYRYVNSDQAIDKKGNPIQLSDMAASVLAAASKFDGEFSIADLAEVLGLEKLANGYVTGLVSKGNLEKAGTRDVEYQKPTPHKVYRFVKEVE